MHLAWNESDRQRFLFRLHRISVATIRSRSWRTMGSRVWGRRRVAPSRNILISSTGSTIPTSHLTSAIELLWGPEDLLRCTMICAIFCPWRRVDSFSQAKAPVLFYLYCDSWSNSRPTAVAALARSQFQQVFATRERDCCGPFIINSH